MTTEKFIEQLYSTVKARDATAMANYFSENIIFQNMADEPIIGKAAAQATVMEFFNNVKNIKWDIRTIASNGDTIIFERLNTLDFGDKTVSLPTVTVLELEKNKIIAFRDYFDSNTITQQLEGDTHA